MSTAAMNAVDRTKAGVASGVLSMSRMVGGTFGVAVMGALVAAIGKSKLAQGLPHVPAAVRNEIANALGSGAVPGHTGGQIAQVARGAFVSALSTGLTIGAIVTVIGAILALALIAGRPPARPEPTAADAATEPAPEADADAELSVV
ncbi:MAG: hypothetical protein ACYCXW_23680, partial [Solirubrobacteraceae bacterium]